MTPTSTPRPQISPSEGQGLPIAAFEGRSKKMLLDGNRWVLVAYGSSDLAEKCWCIRAGTGDAFIEMGLSDEAMDGLISMAVSFLAEEVRDSDQSPKGEDAEAASSRSDASAGPEGIAHD